MLILLLPLVQRLCHPGASAEVRILRLAATHAGLLVLATWGALAVAQVSPPDAASPQAPPSVVAPPRPAPGQGQGPVLRERLLRQAFEEADRNRDGLLSKEEAAAMPGLPERFGRVDANHDGRISREELRDAGGP